MAWFKRNTPAPPSPELAREQIEIMSREIRLNEADGRGLYNRPHYQKARQTLLEIGSEAVPALIEALEQGFERAKQRLEAAETFDEFSEERMAAEFKAMEEIPAELALVLGEIGDPRAVEPLAAVFQGPLVPPHEVQVALGSIHTPEAKAVLLATLSDKAPERAARQGFAAAALYHWERNDSEVVQALLEATDEADPALARQAIHSLVGLRAKEALERLTYLSSTAEDERLRTKAQEAVLALQS